MRPPGFTGSAVSFSQVRRNEVDIAIAAAAVVFAGADGAHLANDPGSADSQQAIAETYETKPVYSKVAHIEPLDLDNGVDVVITPRPDKTALDQIDKGERLREAAVVAAARKATLARAKGEAAAAVAGQWQPWMGGVGRAGSGRISASGWIRAAGAGRVHVRVRPRWGTIHKGIDIANPIGTPIYAAATGTVINAGPAQGFGLWVRIQHDDGTITVYGHIYDFFVSVGERVTGGQADRPHGQPRRLHRPAPALRDHRSRTVGRPTEVPGPQGHHHQLIGGADKPGD